MKILINFGSDEMIDEHDTIESATAAIIDAIHNGVTPESITVIKNGKPYNCDWTITQLKLEIQEETNEP